MSEAMVFIHGFGGGASLWQWQKEHFAPGRQVVLIDLPGHGARPWQGESLEDMARLVYKECQDQGISSADVVGSSFGGLVVIKLAELYPDLVRRIVLAGALPKFTATEGFPAGLNAEKIRKLAGQVEGDIGTILDIFFRSLFSRKEKERPRYFQVKELRCQSPLPSRAGLLGVLNLLEKEDLRPQLAGLKQPALFIMGDSDPICPLALVEPLRALASALQIEVLKDVAHFPFLSIPEVFNRRVERFLQ
ncbi:MAG: alpha/beta hydrolase [Candidatus Omnitrophica bacterium]|nr:alpha/beta hydrolase [Candidatus Omnitrophota bacterium]